MISNPGSSPVSTLMDKSIYDKNNKNTDIFAYTDSKVSDKVTSAQVATQISNATSSFVTSSVVDQKIATDKTNDPYRWRNVTMVPYSQNPDTYSVLNSITTSSGYNIEKSVDLPLDFSKYLYEFRVHFSGWSTYDNYESTQAAMNLAVVSDTGASRDNFTIVSLTKTVGPRAVNTHNAKAIYNWLGYALMCIPYNSYMYIYCGREGTTNSGAVIKDGVYGSNGGWWTNKPTCSKIRLSLNNTHRLIYESCGVSIQYRAYTTRP